MKRAEILAAAERCVCGDREQDYGSPENNFKAVANLWIDYLTAKDEPLDIAAKDVAVMLALLKIAPHCLRPCQGGQLGGSGRVCRLRRGDREW